MLYFKEGSASNSFKLSDLTFRSLFHFEFIFVCGVRKCSHCILLHLAVQFPQHHLLMWLFFSIVYSCLLCQRLGDYRCVGLSLGFYPVPLIYISIFVPEPYCLNASRIHLQMEMSTCGYKVGVHIYAHVC